MGRKYFADDEEVERKVRKLLRQQSKDAYAAGFAAWVKRLDTCINVGGEYVEKYFFPPQVRIPQFVRFMSVCDLFTGSPSYILV
jgi:hypothetical protein